MSTVYLAFGSNRGDRLQNFEAAIRHLTELTQQRSDNILASSLYETPALLPPNAGSDWNRPFYNAVVQLEFSGTPEELLSITQKIEALVGGVREKRRWAPRALDIDILYSEAMIHSTDQLKIPHPEVTSRAFVLDPLAELAPSLVLPGQDQNLQHLSRHHRQHSARLMGILNITPDSFSDGGVHFRAMQTAANDDLNLQRVEETLADWDRIPLWCIDIGGESTRPGATPVSPEAEWQRVGPILELVRRRYSGRFFRPRISLDTRSHLVAEKALEVGVDFINDVDGLKNPKLASLVAASNAKAIVMHSLTVPADPKVHLSIDRPASIQVHEWFRTRADDLAEKGLSRERLIFDPGIGFGKTSLQSLEILNNVRRFHDLGCFVLIGHSRKSYQKDFSNYPANDRDLETIGASLALVENGADILRVHDPVAHHRALLAYRHLSQNTSTFLPEREHTP